MLEGLGVIQQGAELDLPAIDPGAASLARGALLVGGVGDGIGLHAGEEMVVLPEQAGDDLVRGIVGVGDEVEGLLTAAMPRRASILSSRVRRSRLDHTRPSWMRMASGTAKKLEAACTSMAHGLQRVSHDIFGLGVGLGLLMQELDRRHLAAALGDLDAVADQDMPAVDAQGLGEQA